MAALYSADMTLLDAFRFDRRSRALFRLDTGTQIQIGSRALGVLGVLVEHAGDLVPKDEILRGDALSSMPNDRQIVMYCKTGVRSAEALAIVKNAGFSDAVHVGGGVLAWVNQVDPSLPSY